jgi:L-ascorbate 6-phosphate lactonase
VAALELWWLGQSGFRLRDRAGGPIVFCDPFISAHDARTWQSPVNAQQLSQADLILVSHEHIDHLDRPALKAAANTPGARFSLVVPRPLVDDVQHELAISAERIVGAQPDEPLDLAGVHVHPVAARHGVNVSDAYTFGTELSNGLVRYLGYVVELGGVRAYHAGDCSPYPGQAERLRTLRPHLALLPINGRDYFRESDDNIVGNMDFREAARLANDMHAEVLVPMHWELFPGNRGFPGDVVSYATTAYPELSVLVLGRGARLTYSAPANPYHS